jgi:hypothetical protein
VAKNNLAWSKGGDRRVITTTFNLIRRTFGNRLYLMNLFQTIKDVAAVLTIAIGIFTSLNELIF